MTSKYNHTDIANQAPEISRKLARQQLMGNGPILQTNGNSVYAAPSGWECEQLKRDDAVTKCRTLSELTKAAGDASVATIFIPHDAQLNLSAIEQVLNRHNQDKTLFIERLIGTSQSE